MLEAGECVKKTAAFLKRIGAEKEMHLSLLAFFPARPIEVVLGEGRGEGAAQVNVR